MLILCSLFHCVHVFVHILSMINVCSVAPSQLSCTRTCNLYNQRGVKPKRKDVTL